ncbi:MAG: ROK family protein, partial [Bdellovibrionales bacterium]
MKVICFDIGGTQIRAALAADNGLIEVKRAPTRADGDPARLLSQIKEMYQALGADADVFALGCPGPVQGGKMLGSPPLRIAGDIDFQSEIKSFFKNPVFVANDLNMAT